MFAIIRHYPAPEEIMGWVKTSNFATIFDMVEKYPSLFTGS
jgi:hypothetical protein